MGPGRDLGGVLDLAALAGGLAANAAVSSLWQVVLLYGLVVTLGG